MTRAELSAEVAQSKALQQKLKSVPASSATAPGSSAGHGAVDALKLELEQLTTKLNLNEDLTGFAVHSVRQEEQGAGYTCMLNDCAGVSGSRSFPLAALQIEFREREDRVPDVPEYSTQASTSSSSSIPTAPSRTLRTSNLPATPLSSRFFRKCYKATCGESTFVCPLPRRPY